MNDTMRLFATTWGGLWGRRGGTEAGVRARPRLEATPASPLARTVGMPEGHGYETGAVSFRLQRLRLGGMSRLLEGASAEEAEGGRVRLRFALERLVLRGH